ncbi:unnamed protein product [Spirodela intermedia]|uniref:Uncharacterized protein n=1 Tax=Spirodela intermedia TaxID=51605 RepID=A0A7I8KS45_SPIIN|nr:unnamed protein product [Spirodela intermedia]
MLVRVSPRPRGVVIVMLSCNLFVEMPLSGSVQWASAHRQRFVISHPPTNSCVLRGSRDAPLMLGSCDKSDAWGYTPQRFLTVRGTYFCLQSAGSGKPAKLGIVCTEEDSSWHLLPEEEPGLLTWLPDGQSVCLEANPDGTVSTGPCGGRAGRSESQWFQVEPKKSYVVAEAVQGKNE